MNHNFTLLDELLANFRELSKQQKGDDLSHILLEYVDPKICKSRFIHFKDLPQRWKNNSFLDRFTILINIDERIYHSLIIPFRGDESLLPDRNIIAEAFPDKFVHLRKKLIDNLEMAGRALLRYPSIHNLPSEITLQQNAVQVWLFFLHYIIKPKRVTWKRVNRAIALGKAMGVISCPDDYAEDPDNFTLDSEQHNAIGLFSFEPLNQNSYSIIRDITNASIEAIHLIISGEISALSEDSLRSTNNMNEQNYSLSEAAKTLSLSSSRFSDYRKLAEVSTSGKRGYRMPESDLRKIATYIVENSHVNTVKEVIDSCKLFLNETKSK